MDPSEIDALVQRLVANPHDEEALSYAHDAGASDPKSYALLLEQVGNQTQDSGYAAHWLSEAANVWLTTLGDAHRAARVLMAAIDKDPTQQVAADRLAQLYRDKGDVKALVALLDRRAKSLTPLAAEHPEIRASLAAMHEELGRLWSEPPLAQPKKAVEAFKKAIELDPESAYAIYHGREILKSQGQWEEAFGLYDMEYAIENEPARKLALLRDEAQARKASGDLSGATRALARARQLDDQDPALQQEYAASVLDRLQSGEAVPPAEKKTAIDLLIGLAEVYDGEHGMAYAAAGLDLEPGSDRALQLYAYYARTLQREDDLAARYLAYVEVNPNGSLAGDARQVLADSYEHAGEIDSAIAMLGPLREAGNASAAAKIDELTHTSLPRSTATATSTSTSMSTSMSNSMSNPSSRISNAPVAAKSSPPAARMSSAPGRTSALAPDKMQGILDAAQMLAGKGKKPEALSKYKEVLETDPAHPEALAWVEDYLRTKRDYGQLRDVLLASVRVMNAMTEGLESRKERLREVAGLCEGNLRDIDGAISAWRQLIALDRADDSARQSLARLLERTQRWDELASLYEQEATAQSDTEIKVQLEKKLANLNEQKRRDFVGAAEAWARIARLTPEDDRAILTASRLFEKGGKIEQAAQVIADSATTVEDQVARGSLLERLGQLREQLADIGSAGEAYAHAADAQKSARLWEDAERCFLSAERWNRAAHAAAQRALLAGDPKQQAQHFARAGELLAKSGDHAGSLTRLEQATDLDPTAEDYASAVVDRYTSEEAWPKLVEFLSRRGDRLTDRTKRVALRRQAATLYLARLNDKDKSRDQWLKVLEDGDDREALEKLVDLAVEREDHTEAATLLRRLGGIAIDKADKARVALREAELLAEGVGDVDTAIVRYESILAELDSTCRPALQAIADLQEARDNPAAAADALERELKLVADPTERGQIAARLARLYELLDDPRSAIRALDIVRKADLEDFDALARLCQMCERVEQWDRVAELLAEQIEVEGDEVEAAGMTKKLAMILADRLDRGDEALAVLTELADQGDATLRQAYIELGDRLGWKGIVATKLVEWWFEARNSPERTAALRGAFERFAEIGRDQDAARVAIEIVRARAADRNLAAHLESLAVKTNDLDALSIAHELLGRELQGVDRAMELVRQAEVAARAGMPRMDAIQHGEAGLSGLPAADAEPLLDRLAELADKSHEVVELYERQVSRSRAPADRLRALARASQIAATKGQVDRSRGFFELALTGSPSEETLNILEEAATEGDRYGGGEKLRRALCVAMSQGGGGARDGGRTRSLLLRRAARIAEKGLHDIDQAFAWLGDALIAHVDETTLDTVEALGNSLGNPRRSEDALTRALSEVFDGPLVRQLLARRAKVRREHVGDKAGAAADLKKLHDLTPNDQAVLDDLSGLLRELGDYRGMVQLYEDQILRGKDMNTRAELARKVARMWEEQLQDPREAADAWRRVLRMKAGDQEAADGLERAKSNMLKKPDPNAGADAYAPPKLPPLPPASLPPSRTPSPPEVRESAPPARDSSPAPRDSAPPAARDSAPPAQGSSPSARPQGAAASRARDSAPAPRARDSAPAPRSSDRDVASVFSTPLAALSSLPTPSPSATSMDSIPTTTRPASSGTEPSPRERPSLIETAEVESGETSLASLPQTQPYPEAIRDLPPDDATQPHAISMELIAAIRGGGKPGGDAIARAARASRGEPRGRIPPPPAADARPVRPAESRATRPRDLQVSHNPDEVTMNVPPSFPPSTEAVSSASRGPIPISRVPSTDRIAVDTEDFLTSSLSNADKTVVTKSPRDDLTRTDEKETFDFLDETMARPYKNEDFHSEEILIDEDDHEVLIADDLAEIVDEDDDKPRTMPPPIPRS